VFAYLNPSASGHDLYTSHHTISSLKSLGLFVLQALH